MVDSVNFQLKPKQDFLLDILKYVCKSKDDSEEQDLFFLFFWFCPNIYQLLCGMVLVQEYRKTSTSKTNQRA